jgi:hypothetical protein
MACAICKTRREKRHCPGIQGEICTVCCGTQREETIDCPLDCEYLRLARLYEDLSKDAAGMPNRDFPVTEEFLKKNVQLLTVIQHAILNVALERNAVDFDIRDALDGLVRTYQTLGSGLYYESRPSNSIAAAVFDGVQLRVAEVRKLETERGVHKVQDSQILTILVFLQHLEYTLNNQRKRGRSFLEELVDTIAQYEEQPSSSSLIIS